MSTGDGHVWIFGCVGRLPDRSVAMARCMATEEINEVELCVFPQLGVCVVPQCYRV